jgi:hypothetical protein
MGKEDQIIPLAMTRPNPTAPPSALPSKPPWYSELPNGCFPLQQVMVGSGQIYVPFQLSDLRGIKNIWIAKVMPRQMHPSLYLCDPNLWTDIKDIMLLLDQTLVSLQKQWVLAQATQVGNDYHLQWVPILVAPKNEGINVPTPTGAQAVPLTDSH